jgi:sugar/nucleoside kinase (ribokinase family)
MAAEGGRLSIYLDLATRANPLSSEARATLGAADVAVVDLAQHSRDVLAAARAAGRPVWCDIHDYDGQAEYHKVFIDAADVLLLSAERLGDPTAFMAARLSAGTTWVVATRGRDGALALSADGWWEVRTIPVPAVVDTNGAGDAFAAGMLAAHLAGAPLAECLTWGVAAGALCVQSADLVSAEISAERVRELARDAVVAPTVAAHGA